MSDLSLSAKYLKLFKKEGLPAALTTLHSDMQELEEECFDDLEGYNQEKWDRLKEYRNISLELWDLKYASEK